MTCVRVLLSRAFSFYLSIRVEYVLAEEKNVIYWHRYVTNLINGKTYVDTRIMPLSAVC